jgi:general secretion pathway protein A
MYKEYFGLKENPFSIAPDPHYFYMSEGHREALAHLVYGINSAGGFILLTGEVGTGKTTVCRCLFDHLPKNAEIAFILNPKLTVEELLASLCDEFGISYPAGNRSNKVFVSAINDYLLNAHEEGKQAILIIEEAQNLSVEVLEQIRLLTNLETSERKLLQIVLLGQPELRDMLAQPQLRQLSQRVTARYHLGPLTKEEVSAYVNHRLSVAGLVRNGLFSESILKKLFLLTGGIPRLINVICDRALIGTFSQGKDHVDKKTLVTAALEMSGKKEHWWLQEKAYPKILAGFFFLLFAALAATTYFYIRIPQSMSVNTTRTIPQKQPVTAKMESVPTATLEKPINSNGLSTKGMAYEALFSQWQFKINPKSRKTPCELAREKNLQCMEEKGNLSDLRQLNKPAVLKFVDGKDSEYYAALLSLKGDIATLAIGNETRTVDIREIVSRWSGDYTLFWRVPHKYKVKLVPGSRGPLITWLDQHLSLAQGLDIQLDYRPAYDDTLIRKIKEFQITAGLTPDGIVGARTIICLTNAAGTGGPVLEEKKRNN